MTHRDSVAGGQTVRQMIDSHGSTRPSAYAVLSSDGETMTYATLAEFVQGVVADLRSWGIPRNARVAMVLPNGPEMATAFLAVSAAATIAPLNPSYGVEELEFYLEDLGATAVLIAANDNGAGRAAARKCGINVIELATSPNSPAGHFTLACDHPQAASSDGPTEPDDIALLLHTSGTTSRPKLVPLTHENICASAANIAATLELVESDRGLNVMPLFHIHGLMAGLLASIVAGGSVVCTKGFDQADFFPLLDAVRPTWYTAVPTMHQAILGASRANRDVIERSQLRFVRSSSASLPPKIMRDLEDAFGVPVIEAYGMTEAAHQIASNPLPPAERKVGSVGRPAGPEVAVMGSGGELLGAGEIGEIVIRGASVTTGYEANLEANASAFIGSWFRTGDEGVVDADGYLSITGRLKEMVNRGGEKVTPRQIDEVLLEHPAVAQAVAFSVGHPTLGEDLAAAVVLSPAAEVFESELRARLPRSTRWIQGAEQNRGGGLDSQRPIRKAPADRTRREAGLGTGDRVHASGQRGRARGREDLGGGARRRTGGPTRQLLPTRRRLPPAVEVTERLQSLATHELTPVELFLAPTVEQYAHRCRSGDPHDGVVLEIKRGGNRAPVFCVPGHGGDLFTFVELARCLHPDQPVYGFRFPPEAAADDRTADRMLPSLAESFVDAMIRHQPVGPYHIVGFCFGGELGAEMIAQLDELGERCASAVFIHAHLTGSFKETRRERQRRRLVRVRQLVTSPRKRLSS